MLSCVERRGRLDGENAEAAAATARRTRHRIEGIEVGLVYLFEGQPLVREQAWYK